jgi:hypothetical protein
MVVVTFIVDYAESVNVQRCQSCVARCRAGIILPFKSPRTVMSGTGVWEPAQAFSVTPEILNHYVELTRDLDLDFLNIGFPATELSDGARLMKLGAEDWQVAEALETEEIECLIRFFTRAEMEFSGWDAGKTSPVIYLAKILKKRGEFDPDLKKWIKANTDNRFLPNGAVVP